MLIFCQIDFFLENRDSITRYLRFLNFGHVVRAKLYYHLFGYVLQKNRSIHNKNVLATTSTVDTVCLLYTSDAADE